MLNSIDTILNLLLKKNRSKKNTELLTHYYEKATKTEQDRINEIIVCICNYSLDTILYHPENVKV